MNSDATQPTLKLGIAFAGMSLLGVDYALSELSRGSGWWMPFSLFVYLPAYAWIVWVGVFKAPSLQLMWGWGALLLGGVAMAVLMGRLAFGSDHASHVSSIQLSKSILLMLMTGWPLVFDREVKRFRAALRRLNDADRKLATFD